jgi:SAM-dependent methyltransferase
VLHAEKTLDLAGVDWAEAWRCHNARRRAPGNKDHWNKRAATYADPHLGPYERTFLERAGIEPGSEVLDFGCGVGLLAVPLARQGCRVLACDFSENMLEQTRANARSAGVGDLVETRLVAWDDDWEAAGLGAGVADYAIASRSIMVGDLLASLRKLDAAARRRVFVTAAASGSPRNDERAYEAVGRERPCVSDCAYCLNVLMQHGALPTLSYIETRSRPGGADRDDVLAQLAGMLGDDLNEAERAALEAFVDGHYRPNPHAKPDRAFEADADRSVRWAFISWDTAGE